MEMLFGLKLLVVVDEEICEYSFLKLKLDKLTAEVARLELITDGHWSMPVRWFDDKFQGYLLSLSKKDRQSVGERRTSEPYHVFPRLKKEPKKARKKRIKQMVKMSDRVVAFWDGATNLEIERVLEKAKELNRPIREYLV